MRIGDMMSCAKFAASDNPKAWQGSFINLVPTEDYVAPTLTTVVLACYGRPRGRRSRVSLSDDRAAAG